jgi:hypothetical protein
MRGVLSRRVPPAQTGPSFAAAAARLVTTSGVDAAEQPEAFVAVTVNVPTAVTVIDCVVAPVDQRFPVADDEVRVMFLPGHIVVGPLMVGVTAPAAGPTTKEADVAKQPVAFVTVTVYVPVTDTAMDCVVAPVDQRFPVAEDDDRVIAPPAQESAEGPVIVGVAWAGLAVTANGAEVAEQLLALVTVTL